MEFSEFKLTTYLGMYSLHRESEKQTPTFGEIYETIKYKVGTYSRGEEAIVKILRTFNQFHSADLPTMSA